MTKASKITTIGIASILTLGLGTDWFSGTSKSYSGEVVDKEKTYSKYHNHDNRDVYTPSWNYYLYISSDENMGTLEKISVRHGKYQANKVGDKVSVEKSIGGFTGWAYLVRIR